MIMDFKRKDFYTIDDLVHIVELLRDPDEGCDWDKVQTHESIRQNFIEETYEAVDAIDKKDKELLQEELGDVLLQVLLHSQMEKEEGTFEFKDIANALAQKLVLRHPHVFKNEEIHGAENVSNRWEEIKNESHGHTKVSQTLNAVPNSFPALMYVQKLQKRVQAGKLPVPTQKQEIANIRKLLDKMESDIDNGGIGQEDIGSMMFSMVNLTRLNKMDAEEVLSLKGHEFLKIFNIFEDLALQNHVGFDTIDDALFKKLWTEAKGLAEGK